MKHEFLGDFWHLWYPENHILAKYEIKDKNSIFQKHIEEKHGGERQDVEVKVVLSCGNDAMLRQVTEAILIKELTQT